MILTRTPLRISFCGGGSDLPAYYQHEAGAAIGAAIDKYVHVAVKDNFDGRVLAHYRATEDVQVVSDLKHDRMRACLLRAGIEHSIEVASLADVPGSTGLGSSSSFTVGLMHALIARQGHTIDAATLARAACQIEIEDCN
jgi:D-glycero-alpha-D-manno-heptose-7-phosphate kinase